MPASTRDKKRRTIDERIDQFCQTSSELLETIHSKYSHTDTGKPKRKRKKRQTKPESVKNPFVEMDEEY